MSSLFKEGTVFYTLVFPGSLKPRVSAVSDSSAVCRVVCAGFLPLRVLTLKRSSIRRLEKEQLSTDYPLGRNSINAFRVLSICQ